MWVAPTHSLQDCSAPPHQTAASTPSTGSLLGVQGWEGLRPSPFTGERVRMERGDSQGPPWC